MKLPTRLVSGVLTAALLLGPTTWARDRTSALSSGGERAMTIEVDAEVIDVDMEERELVLALPGGEQLTTVVDPAVRRLDEVAVGDRLVVTYTEAVAFELREPTEEELANPWVEGVNVGLSEDNAPPQGAMVSGVRAVCTIEGMNRLRGTVTIQDSRGDTHVVSAVTAERIESLRIGQPVVVTFTQALAVGIETPAP